jgi:PTS system mannose-specific IIB component/fructoselysine and glucoselysine-specific PTS system IIB component
VPIALFRVDERLIHGQVTVGWGVRLDPSRYLVVDDPLATSDWEQDLYRLGTPSGVEAHFLPVDEARAELPDLDRMTGVTILLTRDLPSMARLALDGAMEGREVNLGGIHHAPGRTQVLPYLALGDAERSAIRMLLDAGVRVVARDLPGTAGVDGTRLAG